MPIVLDRRVTSNSPKPENGTYQGWISHPDLGEKVPATLELEVVKKGRVRGRWDIMFEGSQKQACGQVKHTFEPGQLGVLYDDDGTVREVIKDGQAHTKGINKGNLIVKVGADPYSKGSLVRAEQSGSGYEVTFQVGRGEWDEIFQKDLEAGSAEFGGDVYDLRRWIWHASQEHQTTDTIMRCQATDDGTLVGAIRRFQRGHFSEQPTPVARWNFAKKLADNPLVDEICKIEAHIHGSEVRLDEDGLVMNGKGCLSTDQVGFTLHEKTLEVWVELFSLDQREVGIMSVGEMNQADAPFDGIVYNQRSKGEWICCSEFFRRTQTLEGQAECSIGSLHHLVACYASDGTVTVYRDGVLYGKPYKSSHTCFEFTKNCKIVFGARHVWPQRPDPECTNVESVGNFAGRIKAAALYDRALSHEAVALSFRSGTFKLSLVSKKVPPSDASPMDDGNMASLLSEFRKNACQIEDTELRAITIPQLRRVVRFAMERCHTWLGKKDKKEAAYSFEPGEMGISYDDNGLVKEVFDNGPAHTKGIKKYLDIVTKVGGEPYSKGALAAAEKSGVPYIVTVEAVRYSKPWLSMKSLNLYDLCDWMIKPATAELNCSLVELLADGSQKPLWFVSHFWGERIIDFLKCLSCHAKLRSLKHDAPFWVCAYANRQHALHNEISEDLEATSFNKAMKLSCGVLLVLDEKATALTRAWCAFEEFEALELSGAYKQQSNRDRTILLDIAVCWDGNAALLTDGLTEEDHLDYKVSLSKAMREKNFPGVIIEKCMSMDFKESKASQKEDKDRIMTWMQDKGGADEANRRLHATMAIAAWRQCVERREVEKLGLPQILRRDGQRKVLKFDFSYLWEFSDKDVQDLSNGIPSSVSDLELDFEWCIQLTDVAVHYLATALRDTALRRLFLNFRECYNLSCESIACLMQSLPQSLKVLRVRFHRKITGQDLEDLAPLIPPQLKELKLSFRGCETIEITGVIKALKNLPHNLKCLGLNLSECTLLTDGDLRMLTIQHFPQTLEEICFRVEDCPKITRDGLASFCERLEPLNLQKVDLGAKHMTDLGKEAGTYTNRLSVDTPKANLATALQSLYEKDRIPWHMFKLLLDKLMFSQEDIDLIKRKCASSNSSDVLEISVQEFTNWLITGDTHEHSQ